MVIMLKGIIFDIKHYAIHDGPGIRTTVFLKGCAASCWWCHNPESQSLEIEKTARTNTFDGICVEEEEIIGNLMTVEEVMHEIMKDKVFYDESGGGATFSGGEPLIQPDFLKAVLKHCRNRGIHTTLDTTGYASWEIFKSIIPNVDLFLYDIKFVDDSQHQKYTGVSNASILYNLKNLVRHNKKIILRFPVIPGITDTADNVGQIVDFVIGLKENSLHIDILPYHKIGRHKYDKLHKTDLMGEAKPPTVKQLRHLKKRFEQAGLSAKIGG